MEILASIALAGNILQFVQTGLSIVSKGKALKRSHDGALKEHQDLQVVINDLDQCLSRLDTNTSDSFRVLVDRCKETGAELKRMLDKVRAKKGKGHLFSSYRNALLIEWKESHIKDQQHRFECLRDEVAVHLQILMRYSP